MPPNNLPPNISMFFIKVAMLETTIILYSIYAIFLTLSKDPRMNFAGIFMFLGLLIKLL